MGSEMCIRDRSWVDQTHITCSYFLTVVVTMSTVFGVRLATRSNRARAHRHPYGIFADLAISGECEERLRSRPRFRAAYEGADSHSRSVRTFLSFENSSGVVRVNPSPNVWSATHRTVASSIRNGQSSPGTCNRHSNLAPSATFISLSTLHPPEEISRVRPCPSCLCPEKVPRNCVVNLG